MLRPLIPLVIGLIFLIAEGLLADFLSDKKATTNGATSIGELENYHILKQIQGYSTLRFVLVVLKQLKDIIFQAYSSYSSFMVMMAMVNICLKPPKMVSQHLFKIKTLPLTTCDNNVTLNKDAANFWKKAGASLFRFIFVNSLSFILYYLAVFSLVTILLNQNPWHINRTSPVRPDGSLFLRSLEEQGTRSLISENGTSNPPSYLREVTTLNVPVISILLSNDGKTAFLCQLEALLVIDISEIENPKNKSSLHLPRSDYCELSISSTDQILVLKRSSYVHLVNVTNIQAPRLAYSDMFFGESSFRINYFEPSILISPDEQTAMFAEDGSMKIVNISNLTSPTLLNKNDPAKTILYSSVVAYSAQKKVLFSGWASFRVYNMSNLAAPSLLKVITFVGDITSISLSADQEKLYFICNYIGSRTVLLAYNVTDPKNPTQLKTLEISNLTYCNPVILNSPSKENNYLYISLCDSLKVIDLSNINDLKQTTIAKKQLFWAAFYFCIIS